MRPVVADPMPVVDRFVADRGELRLREKIGGAVQVLAPRNRCAINAELEVRLDKATLHNCFFWRNSLRIRSGGG
jgi:hypothetical protein